MIDRRTEGWRPPLFSAGHGVLASGRNALRRFVDLQAGSIWRDLRRVLPHMSGTLVDVGCGAQPYRSLLTPATRYVGIDTVDAKSHFGYQLPDTSYFEGSRWPVPDASANAVLCTETLEHVEDLQTFLGEAARCLVPGGTLILTVPFAARWHFVPHDYWRFTPSGLRSLLQGTHFSNIRVYARGNAFTVACYKNMALILRIALPDERSPAIRLALQCLSIPLLPLLALLAVCANLSLAGGGGDDCLGYTVLAERGLQ